MSGDDPGRVEGIGRENRWGRPTVASTLSISDRGEELADPSQRRLRGEGALRLGPDRGRPRPDRRRRARPRARHHRSGYLETTAKITAVALDKTGTLTVGRPRLTDLVVTGASGDDELLTWAAVAEVGSEHPLAASVLDAAREAGLPTPQLPGRVVSHPGKGIEAHVDGRRVLVGTPALLAEFDVDINAQSSKVITSPSWIGAHSSSVISAQFSSGIDSVSITPPPQV